MKNFNERPMFNWAVDFTVRKKDGTVLETDPSGIPLKRAAIKARDIFEALECCRTTVFHPILNDPDVEEVVIWDIGIIDMDVFGRDKEEVTAEDAGK